MSKTLNHLVVLSIWGYGGPMLALANNKTDKGN